MVIGSVATNHLLCELEATVDALLASNVPALSTVEERTQAVLTSYKALGLLGITHCTLVLEQSPKGKVEERVRPAEGLPPWHIAEPAQEVMGLEPHQPLEQYHHHLLPVDEDVLVEFKLPLFLLFRVVPTGYLGPQTVQVWEEK